MVCALALPAAGSDRETARPRPHVEVLWDAIASGDSGTVRALLEQYPEFLESTVRGGMTPLEVAAMVNSPLLAELRPHFENRPDSGALFARAICWAVSNGHAGAVEELLRAKPPLNQGVGPFLSPLHSAVLGNRLELAKLLVEHGADPHFFPALLPSGSGASLQIGSALWLAACLGSEELLDFFLETPPVLALADGRTVLHFLAVSLDPLVSQAQELIRQALPSDRPGAKALIADLSNLSLPPRNDRAVLERLIRAGADVNAVIATTGVTPLHICAEHNHWSFALALLEHGAELEREDKAGFTPLHTAAENGHHEIAERLLRRGADPNRRATDLRTALHSAAGSGHGEVVELLLQYRADFQARERYGATPLHVAALQGHFNVVLMLIDASAEPTARTLARGTPLHMVAFGQRARQVPSPPGARIPVVGSDHAAIARKLIDSGAPLNALDSNGFTALHLAAFSGASGVVDVLLELGALAGLPDAGGVVPLHVAAKENHADIVHLLLEHVANPDVTDLDGRSPLHWAAQGGALEATRVLLEAGADPRVRDANGSTPVHWAVLRGSVPVLEQLVAFGADLQARARGGFTPFHAAVDQGLPDMVRFFLQTPMARELLDTRVEDGRNALHIAVQARAASLRGTPPLVGPNAPVDYASVLRLLLEHGADVNARRDADETPLHGAARSGQSDFAKLLVESGADRNARNRNGQLPSDAARRAGHHELADWLLTPSSNSSSVAR